MDERIKTQKFIGIKEASKTYGVPSQTLRQWCNSGLLKCSKSVTNLRVFSIEDLEKALGINASTISETRNIKNIIYCRVSSNQQRDDLERQIKYLRELYPTYDVIQDIGSGINFHRKGLQTILDLAMSKRLSKITIAHKDRLARFGYELIEYIITQNGGKITVLESGEQKSSNEELATDLLSIIQVFNCKQMGKRRYRTKNSQNKNTSDLQTKEDV